MCGWCDVTSSTNERTAIPAFLPRAAVGHKFPLMFPRVSPVLAAALIATQSSLVFDFVSRQKIGGISMRLFIWKQLPVPTPAMLEPHTGFLTPRVLELVYTAYDMTPLARDLGDTARPFTWDEERRFLIRAELDAFFFRLYGIERDDVDYIMETFQTESGGLKNNDIAKYGSYRTKETILEFYDRMAAADAAGIPYETPITPPPGQGPRHFSVVEPSIAALAGQRRRARIAEWEKENRDEGARYRAARREVKAMFLFASSSGAYPQCAKGLTAPGVTMLQTDQLFAERFAEIAAPNGRVGCIIPTAIAIGAGGQYLFGEFTRRGTVVSLYDFENRKPLFPGVDSRYKFCLLSLAGKALREPVAKFAFFLLEAAELDDAHRVFELTPEEIALINPNTGTLPIFRNRRDANLAAAIHRRIPVLWDETKLNGNSWDMSLKATFFHMTDDSDLFRTREALEADGWHQHGNVFSRAGKHMLPLYEAKMAHHFDHRWNSYYDTGNEDRRHLTLAEKQDPTALAEPRYWIAENGPIPTRRNGRDLTVPGVLERLTELKWERKWLCGWRNVCRATDERTAIPAFLPRVAVGHSFPLMFPGVAVDLTAALIAAQSSLVFNFVSRQKIGGVNMQLYIWKQLPVPTPAMLEPHTGFLTPRIIELVYTAYDMTPFARDLGDTDGPFTWDEERRLLIRTELDAFFFRLYGIERDDVDYIMETFQTETGGLKHNDIAKYGSYRTKETILEFYDRMAAADAAGVPYETPITPPSGQGPRHPARSEA